ncbi:hypothetical protein OMP40_31800 [Cohnella rhizosphaerae]|uniref:Uncharacterized protein n=1 Tax=Cohnella rhizosphaerae TaxID=1457232 RepID=A0A9X4QW75_9BACL|nr:hypothetical protein [Cohnella rhizosphaerae]MDG0813359.1 hypothetical protein [Cohnella rhizosphaerae]
MRKANRSAAGRTLLLVLLLSFLAVMAAAPSAAAPVQGSADPARCAAAIVAQLSAQPGFAAWKKGVPRIEALGPGTHGWLATVVGPKGAPLGYAVVYAAEDGTCRLGGVWPRTQAAVRYDDAPVGAGRGRLHSCGELERVSRDQALHSSLRGCLGGEAREGDALAGREVGGAAARRGRAAVAGGRRSRSLYARERGPGQAGRAAPVWRRRDVRSLRAIVLAARRQALRPAAGTAHRPRQGKGAARLRDRAARRQNAVCAIRGRLSALAKRPARSRARHERPAFYSARCAREC